MRKKKVNEKQTKNYINFQTRKDLKETRNRLKFICRDKLENTVQNSTEL